MEEAVGDDLEEGERGPIEEPCGPPDPAPRPALGLSGSGEPLEGPLSRDGGGQPRERLRVERPAGAPAAVSQERTSPPSQRDRVTVSARLRVEARMEVESPFASVRLRTTAAKRFKRVDNATALIWRLLVVAEKRFRKLNAPELLRDVYEGRRFEDGKPVPEGQERIAA